MRFLLCASSCAAGIAGGGWLTFVSMMACMEDAQMSTLPQSSADSARCRKMAASGPGIVVLRTKLWRYQQIQLMH